MEKDHRSDSNAFRARVFGSDADRLIGFVCECGDPTCHRTVALTLEEYSRSRPGLLLHEEHRDSGDLLQAG